MKTQRGLAVGSVCRISGLWCLAVTLVCATTSAWAGRIDAWGINYSGICNVPPRTDYVALSGGSLWSVAIVEDGSLLAWGQNTSGECNVPAGAAKQLPFCKFLF